MQHPVAADGQVILPSMTSSKSFRPAIFPSSSLSLSSLRSHPNSESKSKHGSDGLLRKTPRLKEGHHLPRNQNQVPAVRPAEPLQQQEPESPAKRDRDGEPVPPINPRHRARTWSNRLSSFFPTLTSHPTDARRISIQRKPVSMPPTEAPPPPPYKMSESTSTSSDVGEKPAAEKGQQHPDSPATACPEYSPPVPPSTSNDTPEDTQENTQEDRPEVKLELRLDDIPELKPLDRPMDSLMSLPEIDVFINSHLNPRIMDPIPPSPEPSRTTFDIPAPIAEEDTQSNGLLDVNGDSHRQESLQSRTSEDRPRSASLAQRKDSLPVLGLKTRQTPPIVEGRGRSASARASSIIGDSVGGSRIVSSPVTSRPLSVASPSPSRAKLRRSWMPGRSRSNSTEVSSNEGNAAAWVIDDSKVEYNTSFLKNGEKVPELWNESADVLVYLYPKSSGCGPSFKVPEFTISSSYIFNELVRADVDAAGSRSRATSFGGRDSLGADDPSRIISPPMSPAPDYSADLRLYLPPALPTGTDTLAPPVEGSETEMDRLIGIRNLFAFLTGQPLVGTKAHPTIFQALLQISDLLQEFCFASPDGYAFGSAVDLSFSFYSEQLGLGDCRESRGKTLEALILGERMRNADLYNEAYAHAAGKYTAIMDLRLPLFGQVSLHTRQRLERAHLNLLNRQNNVNVHLEQFDFPSLFSGIANSTSIPELRLVRFKVWRNSFAKMRQFVLNYYKSTFGSWPPKATNKKNPFAESGLNRLVLKALYSDMCALYDLLVDRNNLTSRVMDEVPAISDVAGKMTTSALRNILSEFDRSKPPVLPPIPFDLPQLPSMTAVLETYNSLSPKDQTRFDKKIKEHELALVLNKSYNFDTNNINLPFLEQFKEFEMREARGKMTQDLVHQRIGYWLFLYVVIQSLPVLVVDAPGLKFTEGVEYFLCEPPMGNPPWVEDRQVRKMWYEVAGGGGIVELSADAVMFSVEAIYHRSHCWLAAKKWEDIAEGEEDPLMEEPGLSPLQPPRPIFQGSEGSSTPTPGSGHSTPSPPPGSPQMAIRPRNLSPARHRASSAYRSSIMMGLEPLPLEPPSIFGAHNRSSSLGPRPPSSHMSNKSGSTGNLAGMSARDSRSSSPAPAAISGATFDDILGESQKKMNKKKSRFF